MGGGQTGIDIAEVIHEKYEIPYIFLTSFDDNETLSAAQQFSPYGYLVKPFHDRTLLTTVRIALTNYQATHEKSDFSKSHIESQISSSLTDQEYKVLLALVHGKSYKQIADEIYVSSNTIKYHASNIYSKCNIKSRSELISFVL